jgi:hypothetical protein
VIDLHEVAAEYAAVPIAAPTPVSVIVARGRQLRARRRRRVVGTVVLIAAVPTLALATIRTHRESSVKVIAPSPITRTGPPPTRTSPTTTHGGKGPTPSYWDAASPPVWTSTGAADPALINALAAELPASYHLHSSDSSIDQTGHHFEEAIFTDQLSSVASASVFDVSPPGASFEQMLTTTPSPSGTGGGYVPSGTPGVYMQKSNNSRSSGVIAKLTGHRALIVSSSISLAHYGTTHPLSISFLVRAAADLAAKL